MSVRQLDLPLEHTPTGRFLPWIVAGIHLNEIVKDPDIAKDNEFVGFPYGFWIWGGVLSVIVGVIID